MNKITVAQAFTVCAQAGHVLIDIRTAIECSQAMPKEAIHVDMDEMVSYAHKQFSNQHNYYLICATGNRSKLTTQQLMDLGFVNVYDVIDGFKQWQKLNLPTKQLKIATQNLRYHRHYQLAGFGQAGQNKLNKAHVLLIGVGGLGSPSALYLAAAGVAEITLVDDDVVQLSNLQRQIIHNTTTLDKLKVDSAKLQLNALNPDVKVNAIARRLTRDNAAQLIAQADIIIDGSDNLASRYLVNDMCVRYKKPLIYAAVYQYEAQISVFDLRHENSACLKCLFPPSEGLEPENCSTIGVLGVVPGLAGIIQATEAIKIIVDIGQTLQNKLLICNLLDNSFRTIKFHKQENCVHNQSSMR
ncbi:MAG: ThiF family adenylyltransferase [Proteobacteria bacterium]|nr:ThiF family adenylyltransferase [Pseudomonadota bacterium]